MIGVGASDDWAARTVAQARTALTAVADPVRAPAMAAYLRDQFPFLGITSALRTATLREAWAGLPPPTPEELSRAVRLLWDLPEREYQYTACQLLHRYGKVAGAGSCGDARRFLEDTVEPLITTKSWWDSVDSLRGVIVGPLVLRHRGLTTVLARWVDAEDRWLVRSAIIHQLGYGARTDADLLFTWCARRASDREFFIAKAIGWALRTYARHRPDAVRAFVADHPELTSLARREAMKHLATAEL